MPYTPQTWENYPSTASPTSAQRFNYMETQYTEAMRDSKAYTDGLLGPVQNIDKINGWSTVTKDYYVSAGTGNDTTGDGSQTRPYRTIGKAFDTIPKVINKDQFVYLADGTYDEEPALIGVNGAAVMVRRWGGEVSASADTGVFIRSLRFYDCNGYIFLQNLTALDPTPNSAAAIILFSRCTYATVNASRFTRNSRSTTKPDIRWDGAGGGASSNYFSSSYLNVHCMNGSRIRLDNTNVHTGTASTTNVLVQAAEVFLNGANNWISTPKAIQGGVINPSDAPYRQSGFGFINGNGTTTLTSGLTFPVPYSTLTGLQLTFIGAANVSAGQPTGISSFTTNWSNFTGITSTSASGTGTTVRLLASQTHSENFNFGFTWSAEGIL